MLERGEDDAFADGFEDDQRVPVRIGANEIGPVRRDTRVGVEPEGAEFLRRADVERGVGPVSGEKR